MTLKSEGRKQRTFTWQWLTKSLKRWEHLGA